MVNVERQNTVDIKPGMKQAMQLRDPWDHSAGTKKDTATPQRAGSWDGH